MPEKARVRPRPVGARGEDTRREKENQREEAWFDALCLKACCARGVPVWSGYRTVTAEIVGSNPTPGVMALCKQPYPTGGISPQTAGGLTQKASKAPWSNRPPVCQLELEAHEDGRRAFNPKAAGANPAKLVRPGERFESALCIRGTLDGAVTRMGQRR